MVLWGLTLPGLVLYFLATIVALVTLGPASAYAPSTPSGWIGTVLVIIVYAGFIVPVVSAAVMLPVVARRTADLTFRAQLKWFGAFTMIFLVLGTLLGDLMPLPSLWYDILFYFLGLAIGSYCLVRSDSSLVPVTAHPMIGAETSGPSKASRDAG